eukprot:scaffold981_cov41-Phaeocystis_antarctica.AAC.2
MISASSAEVSDANVPYTIATRHDDEGIASKEARRDLFGAAGTELKRRCSLPHSRPGCSPMDLFSMLRRAVVVVGDANLDTLRHPAVWFGTSES